MKKTEVVNLKTWFQRCSMMLAKSVLILLCALAISTSNYAQWQETPCLQAQAVTIVILGSSTAAGAGPSTGDSAWVNRYRNHLQAINPANQVINLAVGGFNTYKIMPHSFSSPLPGRPTVDSLHNITHGLHL